MSDNNRELTKNERCLIYWMLENGSPEAGAFLPRHCRTPMSFDRGHLIK